jgi:hypothetical protein
LAVVPGGPPRGRAAGRAAASEARFAEAAAATVSGRRPRLTVRRHDQPSPDFVLAKTNELLLLLDPDQPHVTVWGCSIRAPDS